MHSAVGRCAAAVGATGQTAATRSALPTRLASMPNRCWIPAT